MWVGAAVESAQAAMEAIGVALEEEAGKLRTDGLDVRTHVCEGEPADVLIGVAETAKADLIVVGSKGMHGARRFIGSVPNRVTHRSPVSVLVVRTD
jgi:nucleotide-binding universal stress UspA family protein